MSVVSPILKATNERKTIMIKIELSPTPLEDTEQYCDMCEDETLHISMLTRFTDGRAGYLLECEPCMLSWDWK